MGRQRIASSRWCAFELRAHIADTVEWIRDRRELGALEDEWRELARTPFQTPEFQLAWLEAFAREAPLRVCTARRDGRLVGLLALVGRGGSLTAAANEHSGSSAPVAADSDAEAAVAGAALAAAGGVLTLPGLPLTDPLVAGSRGRWRAISSPDRVSPAVATAGSFEEWRTRSKPAWGAPLERFRRKMGRDHAARFSAVERPDHLAETLDAGFEVEAMGWKGRAGTAILSSDATALFYRRLAERFHARDDLRVSSIELDGAMAAFNLYLLHERRLYLLKTGFDERFRKLAPGLVMQLNTIERCFDLGLASYELLGDRAEWKAKFATFERPYVVWRAFARTPRPMLHYAYRRLGRGLKTATRAARRAPASRNAAGGRG